MLLSRNQQPLRRLAQHLFALEWPPVAGPCSATSAQLWAGGVDAARSTQNTIPSLSCSLHTSAWAGQAAQPAVDASSSAAGADPATNTGPLALYTHRRSSGLYRPDPRQELTVTMLQELWDSLQGGSPRSRKLRGQPSSGLTMVDSMQGSSSGSSHGAAHKHAGRPHGRAPSASSSRKASGWWAGVSSLLGGGGDEDGGSTASSPPAAHRTQGLYMYGGVGCGKTMLMDLFVETATPEMQVFRTHFHDFMLSVQEKLRQFKGDTDPLLRVADSIAKNTRVLALDEFFVTDVGNAMILARLFNRLWARGCVLVGTSNRHPDALYEGGLNRQFFLPFIAQLKAECVIHDMASTTDYRRLAQHHRGLFFTSQDRDTELRDAWQLDVEGADIKSVELDVQMGRKIKVHQAAGEVGRGAQAGSRSGATSSGFRNSTEWDHEEELILIIQHACMGHRWSHIARLLDNGRTENDVKNKWNNVLRSKTPRPSSLVWTYQQQIPALRGSQALSAALNVWKEFVPRSLSNAIAQKYTDWTDGKWLASEYVSMVVERARHQQAHTGEVVSDTRLSPPTPSTDVLPLLMPPHRITSTAGTPAACFPSPQAVSLPVVTVPPTSTPALMTGPWQQQQPSPIGSAGISNLSTSEMPQQWLTEHAQGQQQAPHMPPPGGDAAVTTAGRAQAHLGEVLIGEDNSTQLYQMFRLLPSSAAQELGAGPQAAPHTTIDNNSNTQRIDFTHGLTPITANTPVAAAPAPAWQLGIPGAFGNSPRLGTAFLQCDQALGTTVLYAAPGLSNPLARSESNLSQQSRNSFLTHPAYTLSSSGVQTFSIGGSLMQPSVGRVSATNPTISNTTATWGPATWPNAAAVVAAQPSTAASAALSCLPAAASPTAGSSQNCWVVPQPGSGQQPYVIVLQHSAAQPQ